MHRRTKDQAAAPHIALVVPDGVGYKNFVLGRLCQELDGPITILHGLDEQDLDHRHLPEDRSHGPVRFETLPPFREPPLVRCLREAKSLSQLYRHHAEDAGAIQLRRLEPRGWLRSRVLTRSARLLARLASFKPDALDRPLESAVERTAATRQITERLLALRPDVVFCTHQRASLALPTMTAARHLGVPTATFVFSWDNLPKGRMPIRADRYLVWGPTMQEQMATYFPSVPTDHVVDVGTPQFEPYFEPHRYQTRDQFCEELGLDPDRPIVCFSGDDESTSPRDPVFLRDVARAIRTLPATDQPQPQLLFRRAPVDLSGRYDSVLSDYPEIVAAPPKWRTGSGDWQGILPTDDDVSHLVNLVRHADLVINLGSTMAMDFALFDKPAIFLNYEPEGLFDPRWNTAAAYQLPHFRSVYETQPVHWAESADALEHLIKHCLAHPAEKSAERQRWLSAICRHPLEQASARCAEALKDVAATRQRSADT